MKTSNKQHSSVRATFLIASLCVVVVSLIGCQQEKSAEKTGQEIDRSLENAGKKIGQLAEQAGQKLDKAGESISHYIDDSAITAKVKAAIIDDPLLKATEIKVTTENGAVRLSGTLDSQEKINRAIEVAKNQENVQSVQNDLTLVVPEEPASEQAGQKLDKAGESIGQYIDDSVITANVKAAIIDDPLLKATEIKVTTDNGLVRLSGVLDSQEKINKALEVAKNQENVKSVQNALALGVPGQSAADLASQKLDEAKESISDKMADADRYMDDSAITGEVKAAIIDDPLLRASEIKVTTENGTVWLSGTLDSQDKINRALEVAKDQAGVKSVRNELTLAMPEQSQSE